MPRTKSALKAHRQSLRRRVVNLRTKTKYREAVRMVRKLTSTGKSAEAARALARAYAALDKAAKKRIIHRNKAARLKSRLTRAPKRNQLH